MKHLLILSLFLIGCCDSNNVSSSSVRLEKLEASVDRLYNRMNTLETQQVYNYSKINEISSKIDKPTVDLDECVWFEKGLDTHGAASYTIPISGTYKYMTWDDESKWHDKYLKAGFVIFKAIQVIRDTCPKYATIDKKGL